MQSCDPFPHHIPTMHPPVAGWEQRLKWAAKIHSSLFARLLTVLEEGAVTREEITSCKADSSRQELLNMKVKGTFLQRTPYSGMPQYCSVSPRQWPGKKAPYPRLVAGPRWTVPIQLLSKHYTELSKWLSWPQHPRKIARLTGIDLCYQAGGNQGLASLCVRHSQHHSVLYILTVDAAAPGETDKVKLEDIGRQIWTHTGL